MEILTAIFTWFSSDSFGAIIGGISLIVTGATAIAVITPTPADDNFLAKARKVISFLSGNIGNNK